MKNYTKFKIKIIKTEFHQPAEYETGHIMRQNPNSKNDKYSNCSINTKLCAILIAAICVECF
jgi:hypothetical protein